MKPFNLEEAKAGKPVCTRDGRDVVIIDYNYKCTYDGYDGNILLIGKVLQKDGTEEAVAYYQDGRERMDGHNSRDLFMKTTHKEGYTTMSYDYLDNLKRGCAGRYKMFKNRVDLLKYYGEQIPIVKIEWEE